jgi:hypothetical protein
MLLAEVSENEDDKAEELNASRSSVPEIMQCLSAELKFSRYRGEKCKEATVADQVITIILMKSVRLQREQSAADTNAVSQIGM